MVCHKLTQLRPDVRLAVVPQAHVELVVGGKQHGLAQRRRLLRHAHRHQRQERTAVVGVRQHQRLDARKRFGRWEFAQLWVVERLQVQHAMHAVERQRGKHVVSEISVTVGEDDCIIKVANNSLLKHLQIFELQEPRERLVMDESDFIAL